jgi:thiamine-phosphate diphosphorylase
MRVIAVTDRRSCRGDFLARIERIAAAAPAAVLLRESDLSTEEYEALATRCLTVCRAHNVEMIVHTHIALARRLKAGLHLRLADLRALGCAPADLAIGTSVHSLAEALEAQSLGASRLIAGHVFATACKASTPGRGVAFLEAVARAVSIPVYAIGGIAPERMADIRRTSAAGVCAMSSLMQGDDPGALIAALGGTGA